MGEKRKYRLEELCDFVNGFAFKSTDYVESTAEAIEVFRMGYIQRSGGFKEDDSRVFVLKAYPKNLDKYLLKAGDIAIAMTDMKDRVAILGNTAWIRDDNRFVLNQRVGLIRVRREDLLDPRFLYFYTNWKPHVEHLRSRANRGVQVNLTTQTIKQAVLEIPPIKEQKAIAHVLGTLDDKIELNRKINRTLEGIARAIFKSWFVDFDPVRAKAAVREEHPEWSNEKVSRAACLRQAKRGSQACHGLKPEIAELFPDSFVDSELGEIPKGWTIKAFGELLKMTIGGDWGKEHKDEKHTVDSAIIRGTDIPELELGSDGKVPRRWVEYKKLRKRQLIDGDIVIEISGGSPKQPTGRSIYITHSLLSRFGSAVEPASFCRLFRPKTKPIGSLCAQHLKYIYDKGKMWGYQNQSTGISNFQTKTFLQEELLSTPDNEKILEAFHSQFRPLVDTIYSNRSWILAKIRDALIPKLISGELRIPDMNKVLDRAL